MFTKELGDSILNDNFLFITPLNGLFAALLITKVILEAALFSHEPCAGGGWDVTGRIAAHNYRDP